MGQGPHSGVALETPEREEDAAVLAGRARHLRAAGRAEVAEESRRRLVAGGAAFTLQPAQAALWRRRIAREGRAVHLAADPAVAVAGQLERGRGLPGELAAQTASLRHGPSLWARLSLIGFASVFSVKRPLPPGFGTGIFCPPCATRPPEPCVPRARARRRARATSPRRAHALSRGRVSSGS